MRAALYWGGGQRLRVQDVALDDPAPREVLRRTVAAGVCHSDVHRVEWKDDTEVPHILGHEGAGIVEAVGEQVKDLAPGDHVVVCTSASCGTCESCVSGRPSVCDKSRTARPPSARPRVTLDGRRVHTLAGVGTFAELMLLHETGVAPIPKDVPLDRAALLGCSVLTGVGAVFRTAKVEAGSVVAVFGCGGVGLNAIQGARIAGARQVIAVDTRAAALAKALDFGATHTVDASAGDVVARVRAASLAAGGVDHSFEAVGLPATIAQAFEVLRPAGVATVIGIARGDERVAIDPRLLLRERKLQGSTMGSNRLRVDVPRYLELYRQGRLKLDELVERRYALEEINDAFDAVLAGSPGRGIVVFPEAGA